MPRLKDKIKSKLRNLQLQPKPVKTTEVFVRPEMTAAGNP